jgi:hypothetical protein
VEYEAIPVYRGNDPIPVIIKLRVRDSGGFHLDVSIINDIMPFAMDERGYPAACLDCEGIC